MLRISSFGALRGVFVSLVLPVAAAAAIGCSRPPPPSGLNIPRGEAPTGWPAILVSTGGRAPALFAGAEEAAPAFGHLGDGVRVRVEGPIQGQRVPVTVGGGLVVHAWAQVNRLAAFTSRRGRVEGTPIYVGIDDPVSLVGRENDTTYRIIVRPRLGRPEVDDTLVGYAATLGTDWIGEGDGSTADTGLNPGEFMRLPAGQEVPLYDRPGGTVVARLPPLDPPLTVVVLRARDGAVRWNSLTRPTTSGFGQISVGDLDGDGGDEIVFAASVMQSVSGDDGRVVSEGPSAPYSIQILAPFRGGPRPDVFASAAARGDRLLGPNLSLVAEGEVASFTSPYGALTRCDGALRLADAADRPALGG